MFKRLFGARRGNEKNNEQNEIGPLFEAATRFFKAQTWDEAKHILHEHANLLLTEDADRFFYVLERQMEAHGDHHAIPIAEDCRKLLARCRQKGIEQSFNELPKYTRSEVYVVVRKLLEERSQESQSALVRNAPELFADKRAGECFSEIAAAAIRRDNKEYAHYVLDCQKLVDDALAGDSKKSNASPDQLPNLDFDVVRAFRQLVRSNDGTIYKNLKEREKILTTPAAIELVKLMMSLEYQTKSADQRDKRVFAVGELIISAAEADCDAAYAHYRAKQSVQALLEAIFDKPTALEFKNAVEPQREALLSEAATTYLNQLIADTEEKSAERIHLEVVKRFLEGYRKEGSAVFDKFFDEKSAAKEKLLRLLSEWESDQEASVESLLQGQRQASKELTQLLDQWENDRDQSTQSAFESPSQ